MSIVLSRIDNRLLHGIVATQWAPKTGAQRIMVIDDEVAKNPLTKESMRLGKPAGTAVSIITLETALANFSAHKYDGQKIFLIAKQPEVTLKLLEIGQKIPEMTIGGTVIPEEESIQISKRAHILKSQMETYEKIQNHGTKIFIQYVPSDSKKKFTMETT